MAQQRERRYRYLHPTGDNWEWLMKETGMSREALERSHNAAQARLEVATFKVPIKETRE